MCALPEGHYIRRMSKEHGTQATIIEVPIERVHQNPANPRVIKDGSFNKLVASIKRFPEMLWKRPPVVVTDGDGYMALGGNQRLEASRKAGLKTVPILIADEWDPGQRKEFILRDNDDLGEWDFKQLTEQFSMTYLLEETGIMLPSSMLKGGPGEDDDFETPDLKDVVTAIKPGTLIEIGPHRIVCGDSGDQATVDLVMDGGQADLIVTDPPYGVDYVGKTGAKHAVTNDGKETLPAILSRAFTQCMRIAREGCPVYVSHAAGPNQKMFWEAIEAAGFEIRQQLIWVKDAGVLGHSDYHYRHEPILLAYKKGGNGRMGRGGEAWQGGNAQNTVLEFPRPRRNATHATEKPVELWALFIRNHSRSGSVVADFFVGSGTTMVCCQQLGRVARCIEIDPRCVQVVVDRMRALAPDLPVVVHQP
jgi:DNA modification methylase